jgi:preprotein translocase subunit YajC
MTHLTGAAALSSPLLSNDLLLAQNVQPKAGTPGTVQDSTPAPTPSGSSGSGSSPLAQFMLPLMMLLVFVPILWMSARRQKKEAQARSSLKKGDTVMTNSGLIGELVEMDDKIAKVKISQGTTVRMVAGTISPYVETSDKAPTKELKEAKAVTDKK